MVGYDDYRKDRSITTDGKQIGGGVLIDNKPLLHANDYSIEDSTNKNIEKKFVKIKNKKKTLIIGVICISLE